MGFLFFSVLYAEENESFDPETLSEIISKVQSEYPSDLKPDKLIYSAIDGMLGGLDPHSNFLTPEVFKEMRQKQHGSFYGIGIVISKRNHKLTVVSPMEGTPAAKLGLRPGDIISKIEGEPTEDLSVSQAANRLKGPKGTKVKIQITRSGFDEPLHFEITRAEIPTVSIPYSFMIDEDTGYIRMRDFTKTTKKEIKKHVKGLKSEGMKQLMFDLRGNPGGLLKQAVQVCDVFLKKKQKVVYTKGRIKGSSEKYYSKEKPLIPDIPLLVLVDRSSASASEIVAGAIQDHDRGLIAGETTWGKGLVQSIYPMKDKSGLALTTAKYYTPSGRCIQRDYEEGFDDYYRGWHKKRKNRQDAPKKKTDHGRTVYGGGGIRPDVSIQRREIDNQFIIKARQKSAFFRFAVEYVNKNKEKITGDFEIDRALLKEFKQFLDENTITYEKKDFGENLSLIKSLIKEEIYSAKWGLEEGYKVQAKRDRQIQKALNHFPKAAEMLKNY